MSVISKALLCMVSVQVLRLCLCYGGACKWCYIYVCAIPSSLSVYSEAVSVTSERLPDSRRFVMTATDSTAAISASRDQKIRRTPPPPCWLPEARNEVVVIFNSLCVWDNCVNWTQSVLEHPPDRNMIRKLIENLCSCKRTHYNHETRWQQYT